MTYLPFSALILKLESTVFTVTLALVLALLTLAFVFTFVTVGVVDLPQNQKPRATNKPRSKSGINHFKIELPSPSLSNVSPTLFIAPLNLSPTAFAPAPTVSIPSPTIFLPASTVPLAAVPIRSTVSLAIAPAVPNAPAAKPPSPLKYPPIFVSKSLSLGTTPSGVRLSTICGVINAVAEVVVA